MSTTERTTREVKTSTGLNTAVLMDYITGREKRELTGVFLGAIAKAKGDKSATSNTETVNSADDLAIELIVKSLNGSTENIKDRLLDLPVTEYAEIFDVVSEIANSKKKS